MNTFRSVLFAAVCLAVLLAPSAAAQALPFSISTYQGNGQMVVSTACASANANAGAYTFQFQPLVVKVVDANGQFAPDNTAVNWSMQYGNGYLASFQTVTTGGLTSNSYSANWVSGSPATPFIQSTISASVASSIATFHETQELGQALGVCSSRFSITPQVPISGVAGSQASDIQVSVNDPNTGGIPNVEVQLVNSQSNPSVSCATGSGADPGTVLTDATGSATCTPILAGSGTGIFLVLVGGSADIPQVKFPPCNEQFADGGGAFGFGSSASCLLLTVTAPTPGSIGSPGGNNQTAYAGQALGSELTAIVKDTNGNTLEGQTVNWTCTPATAGTFKQPSTISDNNGQVANGFTFSASANGNITITATIAGTIALAAADCLGGCPSEPALVHDALIAARGAGPVRCVVFIEPAALLVDRDGEELIQNLLLQVGLHLAGQPQINLLRRTGRWGGIGGLHGGSQTYRQGGSQKQRESHSDTFSDGDRESPI